MALPALFIASIRSEVRALTWLGMSGVAGLLGSAVIAAPIPFWPAETSHGAVNGMNVACIAITCCIAAYYDRASAWEWELPIAPSAAVATLNGARIASATLFMLPAICSQAIVVSIVTDGIGPATRFFLRAAGSSAQAALILVPWSRLAQALFGRTAAAWAVLCAAIVGSIPGDSAVLRMARVLFPALPFTMNPSLAGAAYAAAHATAVTSVTALVVRRYR